MFSANANVADNAKARPTHIALEEETPRDVRILFVLQLNHRNIRQIRRLLRLIYSPQHFYYVHVDPRQAFMYEGADACKRVSSRLTSTLHVSEMREVEALLTKSGAKNLYVASERFPTIWGGTGLLEMFLSAIHWTTNDKRFTSWDYIINLSESDFPILSIGELEAILTAYVRKQSSVCIFFLSFFTFSNKGKTFISSHGYNTGTFLRKQGFNYHFFQCENRMWRFSKR